MVHKKTNVRIHLYVHALNYIYINICIKKICSKKISSFFVEVEGPVNSKRGDRYYSGTFHGASLSYGTCLY